jgi:hypothetical protein
MRWFGPKRDDERPLTASSARLVADAEAFLSGEYANHLRRHRDAVPGWARLNRLAHGDLSNLQQCRRPFAATKSAAFADWPEESWRRAQQLLASELLDLVDNDPDKLSHVQRSVLVPLELRMIQIDRERALTASELVQSTRSAVRSSIA